MAASNGASTPARRAKAKAGVARRVALALFVCANPCERGASAGGSVIAGNRRLQPPGRE